MKRRIYVPLMNSAVTPENREEYAKMIGSAGAVRIFLAIDRKLLFMRGEDRDRYLECLYSNVKFFKSCGYEVGIWLQAFGFGDILPPDAKALTRDYLSLKSVSGKNLEGRDAFCPESEAFCRDYLALIEYMARSGADMIMLDDDLCLSVRPGIGCFCEKHLKLIEAELGERLPECGDLQRIFFTGGRNKYRDAWLKVMGDTNRRFAKRVRDTVDAVDEKIRVGFCAGYTSWDIEGVNALTLTKIFAGKNKPFLRLTGAPYWASRSKNRFEDQPLGAIIECARSQYELCRGEDIDIFSEADSYPRPRYMVPSSLIECFSLALATCDGLSELSYLFDYYSSPNYERGYLKHRLANRELYEFIEKNFHGKCFCGVGVCDELRKIENAEIAEGTAERQIMRGFFNRGAELMATAGIATVYGKSDVMIAVGEDARYIDITDLPRRLVTDIKGAEILAERGLDVGIKEKKKTDSPAFELFGNERVLLSDSAAEGYFDTELDPKAKIFSRFEAERGEIPAAYTYKSKECELLVYTFELGKIPHLSALLLSYERGRQLAKFCSPVAHMENAPGVYQICKCGEGETAILFVNISEDPISEGEIKLSEDFEKIELCGAVGEICDKEIRLTSTIPPYGAWGIKMRNAKLG